MLRASDYYIQLRMEQNPVPPQQPPVAQPPVASGSIFNLYLIAKHQKRIVGLVGLMLLIQFLGRSVLAAAEPTGAGGNTGLLASAGFAIIMGILALGLWIFSIVTLVKLKLAMGDGMTSIVLFCIGMLIPCINLLILIIVNQNATTSLKANGISVGFLGVDSQTLEMLRSQYPATE